MVTREGSEIDEEQLSLCKVERLVRDACREAHEPLL